MSRKFIFSLASIATLAAAALIAGSAGAMAKHGNGGGHPGNHPGMHKHHKHHHVHFRHIRYRGYIVPVRYSAPVSPGPCTCLTKDYTPEGQVVFKDLCTKEMAMAPVDGAPAKASEAQAPTNFAGKTYQDYLAANPQNSASVQKN